MRVTTSEAFARMAEGYTYVDVRTPLEFAEGRPAGAINVPLGDGFLAAMEARFPKDAKILVGCKAGSRSLAAAQRLTDAGYTDVLEMRAGFDGLRSPFGELVEPGWSRVGLPVASG